MVVNYKIYRSLAPPRGLPRMDLLDQTLHWLNFLAPAWALAVSLVVAARLLPRPWLPRATWGWASQILLQGLLGSGVLAGGVVLWGVDGKMATYGALVAVAGSLQWLLCRGWQRAA